MRETRDDIFSFIGRGYALVNPVNSIGVMGAGLAKQFANNIPEIVIDYRQDIQVGLLGAGRVTWHYYRHTFIIHAATKDHFRDPSRIEYVRGCVNGIKMIEQDLIDSGCCGIVIPKLGCGLGGLSWGVVRPVFIEVLSGLKLDVNVTLL